jgi:hypothetical protein
MQSQTSRPVDIQRATHTAPESDEALNAMLRAVLQTREVRQLLTTAVAEFLNVWAERSWWKKRFAKIAESVVDKQLSRSGDGQANDELAALFENETFIKQVGELLPDITNGAVNAAYAGMESIDRLPADEKKQLFEELLSRTGKGKTGALLTGCARVLVDIHTVDPEFLAHTLEPGITRWLESIDFGELKEAVDGSRPGALKLAAMINSVIWQYPSKVIGIFSLLPSIVNIAVDAAEISMKKLNAVPPDLLTDIIIALLKEIDGKAVAGVVDELTEIGRKLHTGSALLGEPGAPQLPGALADKLNEVVSQSDATIFWKGRIALAEIKAAFDEALANAVLDNPEYARLGMTMKPELFNIRMRTTNKKISLLESLDDDTLATIMSQRLSSYDVQEMAELFNTFLQYANRLWEQKPGVCTEFVSQLVNAVDSDELAETARRLFGSMRDDLRPVARCVVPGLVQWICDALQPEDDEYEEDAARARGALSAILLAEET